MSKGGETQVVPNEATASALGKAVQTDTVSQNQKELNASQRDAVAGGEFNACTLVGMAGGAVGGLAGGPVGGAIGGAVAYSACEFARAVADTPGSFGDAGSAEYMAA